MDLAPLARNPQRIVRHVAIEGSPPGVSWPHLRRPDKNYGVALRELREVRKVRHNIRASRGRVKLNDRARWSVITLNQFVTEFPSASIILEKG